MAIRTSPSNTQAVRYKNVIGKNATPRDSTHCGIKVIGAITEPEIAGRSKLRHLEDVHGGPF